MKVRGRWINNLRFADDIGFIEENRERLQDSLTQLTEAGDKAGLNYQQNKNSGELGKGHGRRIAGGEG